jgi:PAS domain S-box-containing protein
MMRATKVVDVNERTVTLFGRGNREELLGNVDPFWPEESLHVYVAGAAAALRGERNYSAETRMRRVDGSLLDVLFTICFPPETAHAGTLLVGIVDLTARKRAQEMLSRVQAEFAHAARVSVLGELTATVAHEVNQPLGAIVTNAEAGLRWLDRAEPDIVEARELTRRIAADARRAADIIARIRRMVTRHAPDNCILTLESVVRETLVFLDHEIRTRDVTVTLDLAPSLPEVIGDRTQLQQVIVNLAVNAMQAMAQTGVPRRVLAIRTALADQGIVSCSVEDSGPGIPKEHFKHMFESFFTTKESGMGIGLPICRSIIEAHGGRIIADNEAQLGGARFTFSLPVSEAPPPG